MKFNVGDKVKITGRHYINGTILDDQSMVGTVATIEGTCSGAYPYYLKEVDGLFIESDLELVTEPAVEPKALDNLEVGDVLENDSYKILVESIKKMHHVKFIPIGGNGKYTSEELKKYGYKLINPTKPTIKINDKEYILNDKLAKAIEEAEEV